MWWAEEAVKRFQTDTFFFLLFLGAFSFPFSFQEGSRNVFATPGGHDPPGVFIIKPHGSAPRPGSGQARQPEVAVASQQP